MPPIRTVQKATTTNTLDKWVKRSELATPEEKPIQREKAAQPEKPLPKPISVGLKEAIFQDSRNNWKANCASQIGTSTRKIAFTYNFVLTKYD
jgi:hypothetical protein